MKKPRPHETVTILLKRFNRTFAEELGIDVEANTAASVFYLFVFALLGSARIGHDVAMRSSRILIIERGWKTPRKMADATWEERVKALDEGGYVRYDERTSTMLGEASQMINDLYGGDLRKLRNAAEFDPKRERALLKDFKGIGDVGANIFFREVQIAWQEVFPFADQKVLTSAKALGLSSEAGQIAKLVRTRMDFVRLVDALVRLEFELKRDSSRIRVLAA